MVKDGAGKGVAAPRPRSNCLARGTHTGTALARRERHVAARGRALVAELASSASGVTFSGRIRSVPTLGIASSPEDSAASVASQLAWLTESSTQFALPRGRTPTRYVK